jgi:hypothetical protein
MWCVGVNFINCQYLIFTASAPAPLWVQSVGKWNHSLESGTGIKTCSQELDPRPGTGVRTCSQDLWVHCGAWALLAQRGHSLSSSPCHPLPSLSPLTLSLSSSPIHVTLSLSPLSVTLSLSPIMDRGQYGFISDSMGSSWTPCVHRGQWTL